MSNGRTRLMLPLANFMPTLPGLAGLAGSLRAYAPSPCWRDSTTQPVKWQRMPKKIAVKLWHRARDFERRTRRPGKQDGALGRNGLAVLHALIFDCLNYATGRLDPAIATIARNCRDQRTQRGARPGRAQVRRRAELAAALHRQHRGRALHAARRRPTPMRSCRPRSGAATARRQSRRRPSAAPGAITLPCPMPSPPRPPSCARAAACGARYASWRTIPATCWQELWHGSAALSRPARRHLLPDCQSDKEPSLILNSKRQPMN